MKSKAGPRTERINILKCTVMDQTSVCTSEVFYYLSEAEFMLHKIIREQFTNQLTPGHVPTLKGNTIIWNIYKKERKRSI